MRLPLWRRSARCGAAVVLVGLASLVAAQPERADLEQQRKAVQSRFESELRRCQTRFAVTACVDEARTRRRVADTPLREALLRLDAQARQQRAAERRRLVAEKQREAGASGRLQPREAASGALVEAGAAAAAAASEAPASSAAAAASAAPAPRR